MTFKEFLEKEVQALDVCPDCNCADLNTYSGNPLKMECENCGLIIEHTPIKKFISVQALGEWAWDRWRESYYFQEEYPIELVFMKMSKKEREKEMADFTPEPEGSGLSLTAIAIDCLGKKEIIKRLEELK